MTISDSDRQKAKQLGTAIGIAWEAIGRVTPVVNPNKYSAEQLGDHATGTIINVLTALPEELK